MLGNPADRLTHLEAFKFRQKTDMSQVHAKNRHAGAVHQFGRSKNGAIPAEHHHDFGSFGNHRRLPAEVRRLDIVDDRHFETGLGQLLDRLLNHRSALSQATMCHHHRMTGTEHRQSLSSKGNVL